MSEPAERVTMPEDIGPSPSIAAGGSLVTADLVAPRRHAVRGRKIGAVDGGVGAVAAVAAKAVPTRQRPEMATHSLLSGTTTSCQLPNRTLASLTLRKPHSVESVLVNEPLTEPVALRSRPSPRLKPS